MGMAVAMGVGGSSSSSVVSAAATIAGLFPLAPSRFPTSISSLNLGLGRPLAIQQQLLLIQNNNNNNSNSKKSPFRPRPLILRTKSTTTILSSTFPCPSLSRLFSSSPTAASLHLKHQQFQIDDDEFQREVRDDAQEAAPCEPNVRAIIEEEEEEEEEDKPVVTSHEKEEVEENEKEMSRRIPSPPPPPPPKLSLSVKERKELASFAHSLGKKLKSQQVGKSGVTPSVATSFLETLEANELLKLKIHGSCPGEMFNVIKQLEEATGSVAVDQIGRTVILYRPSLSKMKKREAASSRKAKEHPMAFKMQKKAQAPRVSSVGHHQLHRS